MIGEEVNGPALGASLFYGVEAISVSLSNSGVRMAIGFPGWGNEGQVHMYEEREGTWAILGPVLPSLHRVTSR